MIDYKEKIAEQMMAAGVELAKEELMELLEVPADESMGDYALPCFKLARVLRKAPPMIAADIADKLNAQVESDPAGVIAKVVQVNAYVNMFLSREKVAADVVDEILEKKEDFGKSDIGGNKTVIVEYSSPNIAKPFHIGHIRSTVIGNAIYKIYDALGYKTIRINHLGDYGTQFGKMICAYRHWGNEEDVKREPIKT
nr:arginine--tRNA ligase [Clostridiales bacterium]